MRKAFAFCLALALPCAALSQDRPGTDRSKDHEALRALLVQGADALNKRNFDAIAPNLHPNFTIITVDNRKHVGLDAFKKYYLGLFEGPGAVLKHFETKVVADDETRFIGANTGVVYGTSQETFTFADGDMRSMQTRWSAVTQKDNDRWKLVNVHFSTNVLDNPVIDGVKSFYKKLAAGAAVVGLLVGALLFALLRRRRA
ncbi:MAG TPA: nuclear transport factor 2 family protein [Burkholderiales bacterium]|nr:nuclear transport factor 2 family protein [Burkholderiales bacterium]